MARVYLSLGSNINRYGYITTALDTLADTFGELLISPVYESESVGFDGSNFLNLVVGIDTDLPAGELSATLKSIEDANGRQRSGPKFSPRTLDIDILTYDKLCGKIDGIALPRDEISQNAFVLLPLAQLVPQEQHPETAQTYQQMWADYNRPQKLWAVDFRWRGKAISQI